MMKKAVAVLLVIFFMALYTTANYTQGCQPSITRKNFALLRRDFDKLMETPSSRNCDLAREIISLLGKDIEKQHVCVMMQQQLERIAGRVVSYADAKERDLAHAISNSIASHIQSIKQSLNMACGPGKAAPSPSQAREQMLTHMQQQVRALEKTIIQQQQAYSATHKDHELRIAQAADRARIAQQQLENKEAHLQKLQDSLSRLEKKFSDLEKKLTEHAYEHIDKQEKQLAQLCSTVAHTQHELTSFDQHIHKQEERYGQLSSNLETTKNEFAACIEQKTCSFTTALDKNNICVQGLKKQVDTMNSIITNLQSELKEQRAEIAKKELVGHDLDTLQALMSIKTRTR